MDQIGRKPGKLRSFLHSVQIVKPSSQIAAGNAYRIIGHYVVGIDNGFSSHQILFPHAWWQPIAFKQEPSSVKGQVWQRFFLFQFV